MTARFQPRNISSILALKNPAPIPRLQSTLSLVTRAPLLSTNRTHIPNRRPISNITGPLTLLASSHLHNPKYSASTMTTNEHQSNGVEAHKPVLFFDIDNCLYPRSSRVQDHMAELIDKYFARHLNLSWDDAVKLHKEYYTNYGLAIEGLVRHHQIDPLEYNSKVDDALPLQDILTPDPEVCALLEDVDRSKVRLWLLTNAYVTHARRVVKLLEVEDHFEGLTYCDYSQQPLLCKPSKEMYLRAQQEAGVERPEDCFFVDDSYLNCQKAQEYGWTVAHLVEEGLSVPKTQASQFQVRHLRELRNVYPQFFKSTNGSQTSS